MFGSKELQGSERHAERSGKVIFNQGSVEDLFIGSVRVEEHLRVTGEREAFVERCCRRWTSGSWNRVTALGDVARRRARWIGALWGNAGGDIAAGVGAPGAGESGMHERGDNPGPSVIGRFLTQHESQLSESQVSELTRGVLGRTGSGTRTVAGDGTVIQAAGSDRQLKLEAARAQSAGSG